MSFGVERDRLVAVRTAAGRWADELIDLGHRNTLLHYKDTKTATLDLTAARPEALAALLAGNKVRLNALITEPAEHKTACTRARNLHKKILELDEEQGVEAGHLARGMLRVDPPSTRGAAPVLPLRAPLLLQPVSLRSRTATENDFTLEVTDEAAVNPVLVYALSRQYGAEIDADAFNDKLDALFAEVTDPADQVQQAFQHLAAILASTRVSAELEDRAVVGVFSYEKLPMVKDLQTSADLLAQHEIITALAGHQPSLQALLQAGGPHQIVPSDEVTPSNEYLVLDADSSQYTAIGHVLAGRHLLIEGPPGTGKSQTIANIIAELAARGKRVLFVTEKRAAIEAVTDRLARVDLDHLVFDLHDKRANRRHVAQQLAESLERAGRELPHRLEDLHRTLTERRARAVAHAVELHRTRDPWDISYFEAQARLAALPQESQTHIRFRGARLRKLDAEAIAVVTTDLKDYIDTGGLRVRREESPWSRANIRTESDLEKVILQLDEVAGSALRSTRTEMEHLVATVGLRAPVTLAGWQETLDLLSGVGQTLAILNEQVFGESLDVLLHATSSRAQRRHHQRIGFWRRRVLIKQARALAKNGLRNRADLNSVLANAAAQRDRWRSLAVNGSGPSAVSGLEEITRSYQHLRDQLAAISLSADVEPLEQKPAQEIEAALEALNGDRDTLLRMPKLNGLADRFSQYGLDALLDELAAHDASAEQAADAFHCAWLSSVLDEFRLRVPHLRDFTFSGHQRQIDEFQRADLAHRDTNAHRVRRAVAENLRQARDNHPEQSALVRGQASRKTRHMAIRRLISRAPDVLLAARPCWAMSPVVVSRMLPAERLFDVVIFDEASQVEPQDAITSIMRGHQLVVAGDPKQLPPSRFFRQLLGGAADTRDENGEDADDDLAVYESILDRLSSLLPHRCRLRWHYRSSDERLIAFSNLHIYNRDLVTFPGTLSDSPLTLDLVDAVAAPGQDGSSPQEVQRVVALALQHARLRPKETLGVITMGRRHADRIEIALNDARATHPELDDFFSQEHGPGRRFFIKNLESVQGDERDAIILSIGYPKRPDGRVPLRFGPVNEAGGERRLNVAVTRARQRMTVVSSFSHLDMDPRQTKSARNQGPELIRRFLEFASTGGTVLGSPHAATNLNGFERSVLEALEHEGVPVHPQWGVGDYRLDFALAHPDRPGQMVLAVEADGERYHSAPSARDRDRLRQEHLERLGWRFHRIWSIAWFQDPATETARIIERWRHEVSAQEGRADDTQQSESQPPSLVVPEMVAPSRGPRPLIARHPKIIDYSKDQLVEICSWLLSDGLLLPREDRISEAIQELGFSRRGKIIVERLNAAFDEARQQHIGRRGH
ncbi:AAA domain-containing protein [Actinoallomurus sp. CA-150999]|uniref:AAA domain-containing protein n=1 Tax=Actinoallomurus sp. CA-150999 TaxID=3239887 RepID=UPI003D903A28